MKIELDEREWQAVLAILSQAPWNSVNQLIMKIGSQMQAQSGAMRSAHSSSGNSGTRGDFDEAGNLRQ